MFSHHCFQCFITRLPDSFYRFEFAKQYLFGLLAYSSNGIQFRNYHCF